MTRALWVSAAVGSEPRMTDSAAEQRTLKLSVLLSALLGAFAVLLGLLSGSTAIVFDGLFSVVDVAMGVLGLWIARLVTREENRTFQYGYWHIEPMSLAFYGGLLMVLCVYAFFDAVGTFMSGGTEVELGWAIGYSLVMAAACFWMYFYEKRTNRAAKSEFIHLDAQGWLMSALATAATAAAFIFALWLTSTPYAYLAPYVDPAILGILSLAMIGIPVRTVRKALTEILMITPGDLDAQVHAAMDEIVARYGFVRLHQLRRQGRSRAVHRDTHRRGPRATARDRGRPGCHPRRSRGRARRARHRQVADGRLHRLRGVDLAWALSG